MIGMGGADNTYMPIYGGLRYELSETELTFLDITLYKGDRFYRNQILDVRTHRKPTNKQLYIHASSYHPQPQLTP